MAAVLGAVLAATSAAPAAAAETGPSYPCSPPPATPVARRICADEALAALDRQMAAAYQGATAAVAGAEAAQLATEQAAWLKARDDCWRMPDASACVATAYRERIPELQARYGLLPPTGSARYQCPGSPPDASAEFFATDPPSAVVTYAGEKQFMRLAPSGSGTRYRSDKRQLWEYPGGVLLLWDLRAKEMRCTKQ